MKKIVIVLVLILGVCLSGCSECEWHDYGSSVIREATCTEDGIERIYCHNCDYSYEKTLYAHHEWEQKSIIKESTCSTHGEGLYICTVCGKEDTLTLAMSDHTFSDRVCMECGYKKTLPELEVGMSKIQVKMNWGEPIQIDKKTSSRGTEETWWYKEDGKSIAVNFDVDGKIWLITQ